MMQAKVPDLPGPHHSKQNNGLECQPASNGASENKGQFAAVSNRLPSRSKKFAPDRFTSPHKDAAAKKRARMVEITRRDNLTRAQVRERFHVSDGHAARIVKEARDK